VRNFEKKKNWNSNFMKIRPLGAELLHEDGRTDRQIDVTKLTKVFRNFAKVPKKKGKESIRK